MKSTRRGIVRAGFAAAVLGLLAAGCAGFGIREEAPRVSLAGIRPAQGKELETALDIDLRVFNRSESTLTIRGLDCELSLNGRRFAEGVARPEKEIAPYASDTVTVTVYASVLDIFVAVYRLVQGATDPEALPTYTYGLKGHLRTEGFGLWDRIPFSAEGEVDLDELAPAR